jgi:hypothetical protein
MKKQPLTNEKLIQLWNEEVSKVGKHTNSQRKQTIEEMMRMRGVAIPN